MHPLALIVHNQEAFHTIQGHVKRHDVQLMDVVEARHHQMLHISEKSKPNEEDIQSLSGLVSTNEQNLFPTASARLIYGDKECSVRVLLDSGSQETFLRTTVANDLKMTTMTIKVLGGQEQ